MTGRDKSHQLFAEALRVMPGGVNSPIRSFPGLNMTPLVIERGQGPWIWDVDGLQYVDYCGSWGAQIAGHSHPEVIRVVSEQLSQGTSFGTTTPYEVALARKIQSHVPSMEKIRFVSSGTEATMSAVRLARGVTRKSHLIKFIGHYHGHADPFLVQAGSALSELPMASSKGVTQEAIQQTLCLPFNEIDICRAILRSRDDIAAVIMEPIAANMGVVPATPQFLHMLREETDRRGICLIFDEVITGFRVGLGGAQALYGITPDLTCLGKIIGGGLPAAAFGGSASWMDHLAPLGEVFQAGTLSGNPLAMRAGLATVGLLEREGVYDRMEQMTLQLVEAFERYMCDRGLVGSVAHVGSMFTPFFGHAQVSRWVPLDVPRYFELFKHLFTRQIYISPAPYEANFISLAHTSQEIVQTIHALC